MEKCSPKVSVLIATYNWPFALELVIRGFMLQSFKDFELVIADDGSTKDTKDLIEKYKKLTDFNILHFWHEDIGYRKAKVHNEALPGCSGELLICMDGDCVPHRDYVKDHFQIYEENKNAPYIFMGRRVEVGPILTERLNSKNLEDYLLRPWSVELALSCMKKDTDNFMRQFSIKNKLLRMLLRSDRIPDIMGCNFSIPYNLMTKINGFNQDLEKYWGEDSDVFLRVRNMGGKTIGKKSFACQYHLFHPRRAEASDDWEKYQKRLLDWSYVKTSNGLVKI